MLRALAGVVCAFGLWTACLAASPDEQGTNAAAKNDAERLCEDGSANAVRQALRDGRLNARMRFEHHASVLHLATMSNSDPEVIKLLISAGADVNAADDSGYTPLFVAVVRSDHATAFAQTLLAEHADPNRADAGGRTPLHFAVMEHEEDAELLKLLVRAGANVNAADAQGATPLHVAVHGDAVRVLLSAGANPNARDKRGRTPLMMRKDYGALTALIEQAHADPNAVDQEGRSALHLAAMPYADEGQPAPIEVEYLLALDADPKLRDRTGKTALDFAKENPDARAAAKHLERALGILLSDEEVQLAVKGSAAEIREYAKRRPSLLSAADPFGFRALHLAARFNTADAVRVLLAAGAAVDASDAWGNRALHFAAQAGRTETVERLIAKGARPDIRTNYGDSALDLAANWGDARMIQAMAPDRVLLDERNPFGLTALMQAVMHNPDPSAAQALLAMGANVNLRTPDGATPLLLAVSYLVHDAPPTREVDLVRALLAAHAEPDARCGEQKPDLSAMQKFKPQAHEMPAAKQEWSSWDLVSTYSEQASATPAATPPSANAARCPAGANASRMASPAAAALLKKAAANRSTVRQ